MAVSCLQQGLVLSDFYSALLHGDIAYHDFEGITNDEDEAPRLVRSLGRSRCLILRNHGLLACGTSLQEAFYLLWRLQRSCEVQIAASSAGRLIELHESVGHKAAAQTRQFDPEGCQDERIFGSLCRRLSRTRPQLKWLNELQWRAPAPQPTESPLASAVLWPPGP
jgi:hypothetical protein